MLCRADGHVIGSTESTWSRFLSLSSQWLWLRMNECFMRVEAEEEAGAEPEAEAEAEQ